MGSSERARQVARPTVEAPDVRDSGDRLRLSWHADRRVLVVSHWRGKLCVATTRVDVEALPSMMVLIAKALEDTVTAPPPPRAPTARSLQRDIVVFIRNRLRRQRAPIVEMTTAPRGPK